MGDVAEVYNEMTEFPGTESFDDRLKDILEPLMSIGAVVDAGGELESTSIVRTLIDVARDMSSGRDDQEALSGSIPALVSMMNTIIDGVDERFISADDLFSKFQQDEDLGFIGSKKGLAFYLAKLGLHRTPLRRHEGRVVRGYLVRANWVRDLEARYA